MKMCRRRANEAIFLSLGLENSPAVQEDLSPSAKGCMFPFYDGKKFYSFSALFFVRAVRGLLGPFSILTSLGNEPLGRACLARRLVVATSVPVLLEETVVSSPIKFSGISTYPRASARPHHTMHSMIQISPMRARLS